MKHRHKTLAVPDVTPCDSELMFCEPQDLLIIGAGLFLRDLLDICGEYPEFRATGILDPDPALKGQSIGGIPVIGWLADIPDAAGGAVIGTSSSPDGFDRESVFHILLKRGIHFPIFQAKSSRCSHDVVLRRGTILLAGCVVKSGAVIGQNCLLGARSIIGQGVEMEAHSITTPGHKIFAEYRRNPQSVQSKNLSATLAAESECIQEIIHKINKSGMEIVLVTDRDGAIVGAVTDGDIRRGILAGVGMRQPVSTIMNRKPVTVPLGTSYAQMLEIMERLSIKQLPVVDSSNRPVRLEIINTVLDNLRGQDAIVMAGGLGSRLRPLTLDTPKPLLQVAGKPILDHILSGLRDSGLRDVMISVNYLGEQIKRHVGDGCAHDLNVAYLNERDRLGTAGALSLLKPRPKRPFLVINGDLLTNIDFSKILRFQKKHGYTIVMCVQKRKVDVPYGVVEIADGKVASLREKPVYEHFINAGIYTLDPACLELIPRDRFFDMPDLINAVIGTGGSVGAFPIIEYWRDIGTPADLTSASMEHAKEGILT